MPVFSQRKYNFYRQNTLLNDFRTNSRNAIGRNPSMVIPLLANQDLTLMLQTGKYVGRTEDLPRASKLPCAQRPIKRAEFEKCT